MNQILDFRAKITAFDSENNNNNISAEAYNEAFNNFMDKINEVEVEAEEAVRDLLDVQHVLVFTNIKRQGLQ